MSIVQFRPYRYEAHQYPSSEDREGQVRFGHWLRSLGLTLHDDGDGPLWRDVIVFTSRGSGRHVDGGRAKIWPGSWVVLVDRRIEVLTPAEFRERFILVYGAPPEVPDTGHPG